jgi:hypothetical protein
VSTLRSLRELVLGETWTVPAGVATTVAGAIALHAVAPGAWPHFGGLWLLAGALVTLLIATRQGPPGSRPGQ